MVDTTNPTTPVDSDAGANTIAESVANGDAVGITASSNDASGVRYSLTDSAGGRFTIDANTGVVTVADASLINFEGAASYNITVQATDFAGNTSTQTFTIAVTNVAPTAPADNNAAANTVDDDVVNGTAVGITALSSDIHGGVVTYSLTDDAGGRFAINPTTGVVTVADTSLLEGAASYQITVQASDGNLTSSTNFSIAVTAGATITGTALKDTINGTVSAPGQPVATEDDDIINGLGGDDIINGLGGDDRIDGGAGKDKMDGGAGNDTYIVDKLDDKIIELTGGGTDRVEASVTYKLAVNVENLTLTGTANINGTGSIDNNTITGNSGNNTLDGGAGADTLLGGGGIDILKGGTGDDRLNGGADNDTLQDTSGFDTFVFSGTFGSDTVTGFVGNGAAAGDKLEFDSTATFNDFADVLANTVDLGNDLRITHTNGTVLLKGVKDISFLHADDFVFVV